MAESSKTPTLSDGNLLPRLATSRQWTPLPTELLTKIETIFKEQFDIEAENGDFVVEGRIYPQELIVRVGYLEHGRLRQINFEASMDIKPAAQREDDFTAYESENNALNDDEFFAANEDFESDLPLDTYEGEAKTSLTMQLLFVAIDALGSAMEEFFELADEEAIDIPLLWRPYDFEGSKVYLQHSTVNSRLEDEADRLLGLTNDPANSKKLFNESPSTEDALAKAEIDSELAFEIQKLIRAGKYPNPDESALHEEEDEH